MFVVAVDFDGTASINPEAVNKIYNKIDHMVIIHTARPNSIRERTEKELKDLGIQYHALVMDKLLADVYIDDRNAGGLNWKI